MGWNEPDKDKDPWSGKNQPPDLDEALKRLQEKFKKIFGGGSNNNTGDGSSTPGGGGMLAGIILLAAFVLWALSGIFIVAPAEQAVILRFGKYIETVGPGPHWIPRFISSKRVMNVDKVSDYSYSAQMLTKDENLVSVAVVVQYRIMDLEDYLFKVADPKDSLKQATSSALREIIGQTTLDQIITEGREIWGGMVANNLIEILDSYQTGIKVVNVSPQPARAPENVQDAFDDAIMAQEDEKRFKEQARAYEASVVPIAVGNARRITEQAKASSEQVVLRAKGDTAEFLKLLPEFTRSPFVTGERMYLDAMEQVLTKSSKIIVDGKAGNMLYLPLEKLLSGSSVKIDKQALASSGENIKALDSDVYGGRPIVRPTERPGRND